MILGLFGDFVSYTTGLVSVIKAHGQFNTPDMKFVGDKITNVEDTKFEMEQTSGNGIIVIRNPFMSLFSYRSSLLHISPRLGLNLVPLANPQWPSDPPTVQICTFNRISNLNSVGPDRLLNPQTGWIQVRI